MCVCPHTIVVQSRTFGTSRVITAPCGHCIECVKKRQNDWKVRICHECAYWSHVYFFTLTYRESMLPCSLCFSDVFDSSMGVLRKPDALKYAESHDCDFKSTVYIKDVQDFVKRMRVDYERKHALKLDMKYFICSEYGPNPCGTKRPHYHGIIMTSAEYNDLLPYFSSWARDFGRMEFVEVGLMREDKSSVANYVSKYCSKGSFESRLDDIRHKHISRAKSVMSHGIGERWLDVHKGDYLSRVPSFVEVVGDFSLDDVEQLWRDTLDDDMWKELDNLIDNMRVYDGDNYCYSLPRYYKDRLFKVKKSFLCYGTTRKLSIRFSPYATLASHYVYAPPCFTYESKERKDVRYVQENFLSVAIALRLRQRFDARDRDARCRENESFYTAPDGAIHSTYEDSKRSALEARESIITSKLSNFYQSNMWKNSRLDFDADTFTAQDFVNFFNN